MVGEVISGEGTSGTAPPELPNYRIIEKLGEGGMASVWLALREGSTELSVIKVLHEHLASDQVVRSRFLREAQVAAFLDHPNVARLYDAGVSAETSYLAMEFIPGQDVEAMMMKLWKGGRMPPPALSIAITLQMLDGLHYAHEFVGADGKHLEIVHRDLSPRNVMLTFDGDVKIIDFGLVRTNLGDFRTAPGMIAGTLRYMSPEQATAEPLDRRSDIYTWAVVLYELLTGQPLVKGTEARNILGAVVVDIPPPITERNPDLPAALNPVLAKALEKDREQRYATAAEFRDAIALAAGSLGVVPKSEIGEFLSGLFPEERTRARRRMEMTIELPTGPAMEHTQAGAPPGLEASSGPEALPGPEGAPPMFERTRAEPRPAKEGTPSRRKRFPVGAVGLGLLAVALVALVLATRGGPPARVEGLDSQAEAPPAKAEAPTPPAVVTRSPPAPEEGAERETPPKVLPREARSETEPLGRKARPPKARPKKPPPDTETAAPTKVSPALSESPTKPLDIGEAVEAFVSEARSELGEDGAETLINRCHAGLVIARAPSVSAEDAKRKLAECRRMLKEMASEGP